MLKGGMSVVLAMTALVSHAQNAIQSVTGSVQSGVEVIRIETAEPLSAVPTGFTIQSPARISLDFPGLVNAVGSNSVDINQGNMRSANVVQAGERTRVVINLKQPSPYEAKIEGNALLVVMDRDASAKSTEAAPSAAPVKAETFAKDLNSDVGTLKDIDFRRGADAAGRVVVELQNNQVGVDIKQVGKDLVVEFLKTDLPEGLARKLDVTDFGTPVQTIATSQAGDRVRMVVRPIGQWEHSAYQSDTQFVLEVREQKIDPNKLTQGPGYNGEKLSLNFQNIEIRSLLQVIADFTNFNVVTSDSVGGSVTLRLKDVPWDQALEIILDAKGLGMRKNGNVLWIAPRDEIAAREKQDLEDRKALQTLEPLRTQSFQMNYAKAADVAKQILGSGAEGTDAARILSERGSVIAEPRTNQLFVTDVPSKLEQVQQLISKVDIPIRQVLIEARIVEADDTFGRSLGVRLGGADLRGVRGGLSGYDLGAGGDSRASIAGSYDAASITSIGSFNTNDTVNTPDPLTTDNTSFVNLPAAGVAGFAPAAFAVSLFSQAANRFLNLEISALEADGRGRIVSSPRVVTADQVKALIEQGTEFPYQTATASGATAIAFRKANLKLEVTPSITPEGNVILDVDVNKDSRGEETEMGIAINTKHVQTQVLVENGGTVVIGGIFEQEEASTVTKIPLLGDIPVVGNLFKNRRNTSNKRELLVFLTPRVIADRGVSR
ncbi:type IV pilus secretin PilQ [Hydrogenophaga sp. 5NK40-0174]|uniref:type IV pilus secretin PilQ n=1 Tax=Hydrogenophaga sp. 5NK40-0174 TaxID=3127649 RepID=UPI00333E7BFA